MTNILIKEVDRIFNCRILEAGRKESNVIGRVAIAKHLRSTTSLKVSEIAEILNKSHPTTCHYLRMHNNLYIYNVEYRKKYDLLSKLKDYHREFCCYTMLEFNRISNLKIN